MTYFQFALILSLYAGVVGLEFVFGALSPHRFSYHDDPCKRYLETKSRLFVGGYVFATMILMASYLVGFVGLYFLWLWAPYLFLLGAIGKFLDSCLIPVRRKRGRLEEVAGRLEAPFEGFLIAILFMGPASSLFD